MAGTAPPVMLTICWLICGPSVKRENGIETEIPGCKMKFELSNKNKIIRKATSTSASRTSQAKLYSFVRLSFMRGCGFVDGLNYQLTNRCAPQTGLFARRIEN